MSLSYRLVNPLNIENWDELLSQHTDASFFHTQSWARVLSETYGYTPKYFSIFSEDKLSSLIPMMEIKSLLTGRRGVSLPFTDYVQPIVSRPDKTQEFWGWLVDYANKSRWQHIDLRGDIYGQPTGSVYDSFFQHDIRLEGKTEQLFSRLSINNRRNIKKALREDVEVVLRNDMKSVDDFYYLNAITRKKHGVPSQPYKFFKNLFRYIINDNKGIVVLARKNGKVVAGSIYLFFGESAIYKYGASIKEGSSLRANNLVMWKTINWLTERNFKLLSLGRTDKNNIGLLRYKNGWAAEQKSINYYRYRVKDKAFIVKKDGSGSLGTRFFKSAPVAVSNALGEVLYRHVG